MEHDRKSKIVALLSVFIATIFLTVAFAVLTKNMTIQSHLSITPPKDDVQVKFSRSSTQLDEGNIWSQSTFDGDRDLIIDNSGTYPTISGLGADVGQGDTASSYYMSYTFYALNTGNKDATLQRINLYSAAGPYGTNTIKCIADPATAGRNYTADPQRLSALCKNIRVNVMVYKQTGGNNLVSVTNNSSNVPWHVGLPTNGYSSNDYVLKAKSGSTYSYHKIVIEIRFQKGAEELLTTGGNYKIYIGDIAFEYATTT